MAASGPSYVAGAVTVEFIFEDKWHQPWSEPIVKIKIGLRAGDQQALAFNETPFPSFSWYANLSDPVRLKVGLHARYQEVLKYQPTPIINIGWFNWLAEPKRFLRGLPPQEQQFFTLQPNPIISVGWFANLSEPKRFKRGLPPQEQPFFTFFPSPLVSFGWFEGLSEPKRFRRRLLDADQEFLARGAFVPTSYTAILDAIEQRDLFLGILSQFNIPLSAYVDIIENDPRHRGNLGIIENVAQSSIVASIVEPETVPSTGAPISTVAGARVAIIVS
jgi:hypothetical protein